MRTRDLLRQFRTDHVPERNPLMISLMAVVTFRLYALAFGQDPLPGSLQAAEAPGQVAGTFLWLGALATTVGLVWPKRASGLAVEFLGVMWFGSALIFWGYAVIHTSTVTQARIGATLSFGIGLGCLARAVQIALFVRSRTRGKAASGRAP